MPNHIHGIIQINNDLNYAVGAGLKPAPTADSWLYWSSQKKREANKITDSVLPQQ